jgi:ribose-phosphate pyrophosphokinase
MLVINLARSKSSHIPYEVINFSDSQKLITILDTQRAYLEDEVRIISRMSWDDLQLIIQTVNVLKELRVQNIILEIPYLLGARSDRKFSKGSVNYIKTVIAPIINSLGVSSVIVQDPHSLAVENCINNVSFTSYLARMATNASVNSGRRFVLVSPDEGAIKRTDEVASIVKPFKVVRCMKNRDISTGKIKNVSVLADDLEGLPCIVVDDICDGGATFLGLAEALKAKNAGDLYLCVSHGIFSKGVDTLLQSYVEIHTTNSVRDFTPTEQEKIHISNVL